MIDIEPFHLFRRTILLLCVIYALVQSSYVIWQWHAWGVGAGRRAQFLRRWVVFTLLKIRIRRFTMDLLEIMALALVLACLIVPQL